jgi:undecaprenyl diphosphate synthase
MKHVAIIMYDDRRFARKNKISLKVSYENRANKIKEVCNFTEDEGISILFSYKNWKHSESGIKSVNLKA